VLVATASTLQRDLLKWENRTLNLRAMPRVKPAIHWSLNSPADFDTKKSLADLGTTAEACLVRGERLRNPTPTAAPEKAAAEDLSSGGAGL
jgi:hypothetical protein